MKRLLLITLLLVATPSLSEEEELPTSKEAVSARDAYLERVEAAEERMAREVERAKELYERDLNRALKRSEADGDQEEVARIEATIAVLKGEDVNANKPEAPNPNGEDKGDKKPITSIKQFFEEMPQNWSKGNFPNARAEADFRSDLKEIFSGRKIRIPATVKYVVIHDKELPEGKRSMGIDSVNMDLGKIGNVQVVLRLAAFLEVDGRSPLLDTEVNANFNFQASCSYVHFNMYPRLDERDGGINKIELTLQVSNYKQWD